MIKKCVEQILNKTKKYRFIKKRNIAVALMINFIVLAELVLTGMTFDDSHLVALYVDGEEIKIHTHGVLVSDILEKKGIILGEHDEVIPPLDTVITGDNKIVVNRVEYLNRSISEPIYYDTEYVESSLLKIGTENLTRKGENGSRVTTYTEKIVNGVTAESKVTATTVHEPVNEIITVGSAINEPYSKRLGDFELDDGIPTEYAYVVSGKVTAYTAPPGSGTYSGRPLEIGTVAVNPEIIPFGSELYICSKDGKRVYGYAVAADTGDLTEVVADVFMGLTSEHYADACAWGAQDSYVYVLTVGDNSVSWR